MEKDFSYRMKLGALKTINKMHAHLWNWQHLKNGKPRQCFQPAVDLEQENGLSGISQSYVLPLKHGVPMSPDEFQEELLKNKYLLNVMARFKGKTAKDEELIQEVSSVYKEQQIAWLNEIVAANKDIPGIEKLQEFADSDEKRFHVIFGATSGFNIDDIEWVVQNGNWLPESNRYPGWRGIEQRLQDKLQYKIEYVPSPKTLVTLAAKVKARELEEPSSGAPTHCAAPPSGRHNVAAIIIDGKHNYADLPETTTPFSQYGNSNKARLLNIGRRTTAYWQQREQENKSESPDTGKPR